MSILAIRHNLNRMRSKINCPKCKKSGIYDKSDCVNIGTIAVNILAVRCRKCDSFITLDKQKPSFRSNKDIVLERDKETGGISIKLRKSNAVENKKAPAAERAATGDIREYWVQKFFHEHHKDYGFKSIDGPYDVGPDFVTRGGIGIEVERIWKSYLYHRHHLNDNFSNVKFLIVLSPARPTPEKRKLLPKTIVYLDHETFLPWYRENARQYAELKARESEQVQLTLRLEIITGEFYRRWLQVCPRTDGDMAVCPDCQSCAYEPEFDFLEWATEFVMLFDYSIWTDDFSFTDINPKYLDKFFMNKLSDEG
jgi:hypothetical protein